MLIQELYYLYIGFLAIVGLICLAVEPTIKNTIKSILLYTSILLVLYLEQEADLARCVSCVTQAFILYLIHDSLNSTQMADQAPTSDTVPTVQPTDKAPTAMADAQPKSSDSKEQGEGNKALGKRKGDHLPPLFIPTMGQTSDTRKEREHSPALFSPRGVMSDVTKGKPALPNGLTERPIGKQSKMGSKVNVHCQIVTAEGERPSMIVNESVKSLIKDMALIGNWIVTPFDRHRIYMLVQLLHAGLTGNKSLDNDHEIDIYMYLTAIQNIIAPLEDISLTQYEAKMEGKTNKKCECLDLNSRKKQKNC